jgi:mannose-6-phosphate isomerase-like protein (cupin superfamily)
LLALGLAGLPTASPTQAQEKFVVKPLAEKKLEQLPAGPLYWRIENFPTLAGAQAAAGPASLAVEADGRAWLFTLGGKGGTTAGGHEVAEIGPIPRIAAPSYLLRINSAIGSPGAKTRVHSHPGSETFYVLSGRLEEKTTHGVMQVAAGQAMPGQAGGTPMEASSSGSNQLNALVMFVVDATRPFSTPAKFE